MYPYQRNQASYAPVYYPSVPPQVEVDPARSPAAYESWPWDGSYGYGCSHAVQCHGCCNHNYSPGHFMLRPPYPYVPLPHCHGYASMPGPYPVQYVPHYTMDIPRYEYKKDMPREHHCCGCPNHPCSQKEGKSIKIEEEEPGQLEMKGNRSLVPYEFKNCPYPIVWLPPGYMKPKERRSADDSEYCGQDKSPHEAKYSKAFEDQPCRLNGWFPFEPKNHRSLKQGKDETSADYLKSSREQPIPWNWWFPFDAKNLGSLKQGEERKRRMHNQDADASENSKSFQELPSSWNGWFPIDVNKLRSLEPGEDQKRNPHNQEASTYENSKSFEGEPISWNGWFPVDMNKLRSIKPGEHGQHDRQNTSLPMFWIPDKPEATEKEEPKGTFMKQEPASHILVKHKDPEAGPEVDIKDEGPKLPDKDTVQKTIPVKQMEQNVERNTCSKEKTGGKSSDEDSLQRPSSSSKKSSKLPPVCLRVDPLPKKKGVNGHSRSPSPPGDKGKSHDSSGMQSGTTMSSILKESANAPATDNKTSKMKEAEQNNSKVKDIEVRDGTSTEKCRKVESAYGKSSGREKSTIQVKKVSGEGDVEEKRSEEYLEPKEDSAVQSTDARCQVNELNPTAESSRDQATRSRRMKLSEAEAAVLIQSAFRGFEVRKWAPLKKLKQLAKIKEQMGEVKNRIKALESSSVTTEKEKQRTIITEMIMDLLLKLDAIQGVHPSIRDIRKSVAKELVSLQETLDLLICKSPERCPEQLSAMSLEENMSKQIEADLGTSEETTQDKTSADCSLSRSEQDFESAPAESCQNQPRQEIGASTKDVEISNTVMADGNLDGELTILSGIDSENGSRQAVETGSGENNNNNNTDDSLARQVPNDGDVEQTFEPQQVGGEATYILNSAEQLQVEKQRLPIMSNPENKLGGEVQEIHSIEVPEEMSLELHETPVNEEEISNTEMAEEVSPELLETPVSEEEIPNTQMVGGLLPEPREDLVHEQEIPDASTLREVLPEQHDLELEIPNTEVDVAPETDSQSLKKMLPEHVQEIPNAEELGKVLPALHKVLVDVQGVENGGDVHGQFPEAKTEAGANTFPDECSTIKNEAETCNFEQPAKISDLEDPVEAEVLKELPILDDEMQDLSILLNEEDGHAKCEAPLDLSREYDVGNANEYMVELGAQLPDVAEVTDDHIVPEAHRYIEAVPADIELVAQRVDSAAVGGEDNGMKLVDGHATKQGGEGDRSPLPRTASQVSHMSDALTQSDEKLIEENAKLREMMEKLIEAGNKQLNTISSLSGRINDLERRLSRRKKLKIKRPRAAASGSSCLKTQSPLEKKALGLAM